MKQNSSKVQKANDRIIAERKQELVEREEALKLAAATYARGLDDRHELFTDRYEAFLVGYRHALLPH